MLALRNYSNNRVSTSFFGARSWRPVILPKSDDQLIGLRQDSNQSVHTSDESIGLRQDNNDDSNWDDLTEPTDKETIHDQAQKMQKLILVRLLEQKLVDTTKQLSQLKVSRNNAIALLQSTITAKAKGGSYTANNATGLKRLVEQALLISCTYRINPENPNKNCKNITADKEPALSNAMLLIKLTLTVVSRY